MDKVLPIFRRRKGGRWAVVGPEHLLVPGDMATVAKRDGSTTQVLIEEVSEPFWEDGVQKRWGHFSEQAESGHPSLF